MNRHPLDRLQRRRVKNSKFKTNDEKKQEKAERPGRVWRKLSKEAIQEQETQDELRSWRTGSFIEEDFDRRM